jgi:CBS domain-containing protein
MSPRAAARLASLGFDHVYDYVAGKADWGAAGLPLEGETGSEARAGAHVRADVPTCQLGERFPDVRAPSTQAGWSTCFVIDNDGILLGRLGRGALQRGDDVPVEDAMTPGPSTIRPNARLGATVRRMREQNLTSLPVTTSDGRFVGLLVREEAERALAGLAGD